MKLMAFLMLAQAVIAATPPQPKKVILDSEAYPEAARNAGVEGDIAFDLAIDAKGAITGCTVTKGADQPANLAADACALARANWKFLPARDGAGKKVPGSVHYEVAFRISRRCPPPDGKTLCVFL